MCQAEAQPSLAEVAAEAFAELGVIEAAERAASARRLLLNRKAGRADAAVRVGDTVELLPTAVPLMSERVVAAEAAVLDGCDGYDAATLREFVAEAQLALADDPASLVVEVKQCADLAEFLRARPALERGADGLLTATVVSLLEPQWSRAEHLSNAAAPLLFERDQIEVPALEVVRANPNPTPNPHPTPNPNPGARSGLCGAREGLCGGGAHGTGARAQANQAGGHRGGAGGRGPRRRSVGGRRRQRACWRRQRRGAEDY
jgi:hypothetical protein